jgi:hypothetical protein
MPPSNAPSLKTASGVSTTAKITVAQLIKRQQMRLARRNKARRAAAANVTAAGGGAPNLKVNLKSRSPARPRARRASGPALYPPGPVCADEQAPGWAGVPSMRLPVALVRSRVGPGAQLRLAEEAADWPAVGTLADRPDGWVPVLDGHVTQTEVEYSTGRRRCRRGHNPGLWPATPRRRSAVSARYSSASARLYAGFYHDCGGFYSESCE